MTMESLSARRAWIEIRFWQILFYRQLVALRKESVDRNARCPSVDRVQHGRSPQGERG